jgi:FlaA1/EpsC-like NDP-sugar epimerase
MSQHLKACLAICFDAIGIVFSFLVSMVLLKVPFSYNYESVSAVALFVTVNLSSFYLSGFYREIISHMKAPIIFKVLRATLVSGVIIVALQYFSRIGQYDWRLVLTSEIILFCFFVVVRFSIQYALYGKLSAGKEARVRAAIYGAGISGIQVASALEKSVDYCPVAFIDDNEKLQKRSIQGLNVYGADNLACLIDKLQIKEVLLAIPSCPPKRRRAILEKLLDLPVHVRTVPRYSDIVSGKANISDLRDVSIEDIMVRAEVKPDSSLLQAGIKNKVVLVTGAGGSIGAELCKQIISLHPSHIILLELSEFALYRIERDLEALNGGPSPVRLTALIGDVCDGAFIRDICQRYTVQTIYHAAAYKHVPLVEKNPLPAVRNNVLGTYHVAEAACSARVETFILISTDKAVNPTNVMGATKRLAEMVLQALNDRLQAECTETPKPKFCMVRFGNVLGSSGSVIPLFKEQLKKGGPITLTHEDVTRYFMTIPEASQLVLQAGSLAGYGDVCVLDMGEPVKIYDLAKKIIKLSGRSVKNSHNPDGDIEIKVTGLRPGEKLYEELVLGDNIRETVHKKIMVASEEFVPWPEFKTVLAILNEAVEKNDLKRVIEIFHKYVKGYRCSDTMENNMENGLVSR